MTRQNWSAQTVANVCLRLFCYFITSVCRKFSRSLQELSFVCHSLLFVQLLASGKNSTKFKADTTRGVTQGKKNKLICVADFCPPLFAQFFAHRIWNVLSHSIWGGPSIPVKTITVRESACTWIYFGGYWALNRGEWHRLKEEEEEESLTNSPAGEVAHLKTRTSGAENGLFSKVTRDRESVSGGVQTELQAASDWSALGVLPSFF